LGIPEDKKESASELADYVLDEAHIVRGPDGSQSDHSDEQTLLDGHSETPP
jgi:hypothetical protein